MSAVIVGVVVLVLVCWGLSRLRVGRRKPRRLTAESVSHILTMPEPDAPRYRRRAGRRHRLGGRP